MPVLERRWEGDAFCAETITKFATNVTLTTTKHSQCYICYFRFIFRGLANNIGNMAQIYFYSRLSIIYG